MVLGMGGLIICVKSLDRWKISTFTIKIYWANLLGTGLSHCAGCPDGMRPTTRQRVSCTAQRMPEPAFSCPLPPDKKYDAMLRVGAQYGYIVRVYDDFGETRVGLWPKLRLNE